MKKILIIDDEDIVAELLKRTFERRGYEAKIVKTGYESLGKIKEIKPDLILLSIALSGLGGFEVMENIVNDSDAKNIPVIMISNSGHDVERERAYELGVRDLIIKTEFDLEDILKKVEKQLVL